MEKKEEYMSIIKELCAYEVGIKEDELGRPLSWDDIPECFSVYSESDPECQKCILDRACKFVKEQKDNESVQKVEEEGSKEEKSSKEQSSKKQSRDQSKNQSKEKSYGSLKKILLEALKKGVTRSELVELAKKHGSKSDRYVHYLLYKLNKEGELEKEGKVWRLKATEPDQITSPESDADSHKEPPSEKIPEKQEISEE